MGETHTFEYHLRESDKIKTEFLERTIQARGIKTENLAIPQKLVIPFIACWHTRALWTNMLFAMCLLVWVT
jgi:hypothetical protein